MSTSGYEQFLAKKHFDDLDGLRAIAVLAVIWSHTRPAGWNGVISTSGHHGVTLFFAISGFLITSLLIREIRKNGRIDFTAFYIRRALRILPLYFGTLLVYALLVNAFETGKPAGEDFWRNLKYFATFTSNIFVPLEGDRVIFYFSWSVATEEQFYLIWPPLLFALASLKARVTILTIVLGVAFWYMTMFERTSAVFPFAILGGSLLAVVAHSPEGYRIIHRYLGHRSAPPALACLFLATLYINDPTGATVHITASLMVASCVLAKDHSLRIPLNLSPIAYLGSISYGMYMLHMLCKNVATRLIQSSGISAHEVAIFLTTLVLTVLIASASFFFFERRFLALKHRFVR